MQFPLTTGGELVVLNLCWPGIWPWYSGLLTCPLCRWIDAVVTGSQPWRNKVRSSVTTGSTLSASSYNGRTIYSPFFYLAVRRNRHELPERPDLLWIWFSTLRRLSGDRLSILRGVSTQYDSFFNSSSNRDLWPESRGVSDGIPSRRESWWLRAIRKVTVRRSTLTAELHRLDQTNWSRHHHMPAR